ncbi:glycoside hydrolase family 5 protein [Blastopirellula sp. JC732]|uniref:Glycoside hydrolase family 5 protein n=1 Tax=Blastopirellula sediminis TaxID=2894196 RepID=A0A9X1MNC1_9BACT|nr:cellulase family glycosylhydrolase [Blastopirellula sediminis]MCC9607352.1 glycoside hydrolase family 5 protein [Blastopirellula sediminis]MCC9629355.1 glycoside hydrolase family 5 protein [Blastopirellula sediminis]
MNRFAAIFLTSAVGLLSCAAFATAMEPIKISSDGHGFVYAASGKPFTPWGFNYDHDGQGRLLEDYWNDEWKTVEEDFAEMKALGANVVRIHLQLGRFMETAEKPNSQALAQLTKLLELAEQQELYLDLTGLGCYHKQDIPAWYDEMDEATRWKTQAAFWSAVAETCAASPAVFCYDLMNEPVVPGGNKPQENWLGPGLGDKFFVQFITRDRADRERPDVALAWINTLVAAIRAHDKTHLITVGLVPWSLDRPGLTSGFVPAKVAGPLDFIAVHLYPKQDKQAEALETLAGFAAIGKPVVIEEMFPLACSPEQLSEFIDESKPQASGWIGFYWGKTPEEYRTGEKTIGNAITLAWLELFQKKANAPKN